MKYVLDTTCASALIRSEPAPSERMLALRPSEVAIPEPVIAEICYGLARLERSRRQRNLEERFLALLDAVPRVSWSDEVSRRFGAQKADLERRGMRVDDFDVAIAAHALAHDAVLVTSNLRHFARMRGLTIEDWSAPRA